MLSTVFNQIKVEVFKSKFACFDLRKIQNIIDNREERFSTGANGFGKLPLLGFQVAFQ